MPIQNLNGVSRKNGRPVPGIIYGAGLAAMQHPVVTFSGASYSQPFTESSKSVFPTGRSIATQPALPALNVEAPGDVVHTASFVKVEPHTKGSTFSTTASVHHAQMTSGGPSQDHDTPANPNQNRLMKPRPARKPTTTTEGQTNLSFLRGGGTLSSHANHDKDVSRWTVTKKGAVE